MPKTASTELQVKRYYKRRRLKRIFSLIFVAILRLLGIIVTVACIYLVFFDGEATEVKGFAAAGLFVLLYAQCASFSMLGLRLFARRETRTPNRLAFSAIMICAPLYFLVFVVSIIPLTERAAFFLTVFPTLVLNTLPMESIRDEFLLRGFSTPLFWTIQLFMQMLVFVIGQCYGQYLLHLWG